MKNWAAFIWSSMSMHFVVLWRKIGFLKTLGNKTWCIGQVSPVNWISIFIEVIWLNPLSNYNRLPANWKEKANNVRNRGRKSRLNNNDHYITIILLKFGIIRFIAIQFLYILIYMAVLLIEFTSFICTVGIMGISLDILYHF